MLGGMRVEETVLGLRADGRPGRVVVVGSANMDLVVRAAHLPAPGETVLGGDLLRVPGGKGANQAVAAARLGARVRFVGALGRDGFGEDLLAGLRDEEIDLGYVVRSDRPSGAALIVVDDAGENLIAVAPGANFGLPVTAVEAGVADLAPTDVVLVQLEVPPECVAAALGARARTILNAAPAGPVAPEVMRGVEVLVVNATEAASLSGHVQPEDAAHALRMLGPETVIVTLGADGLLALVADGQLWRVPAHRVPVVDTTAAGDAFCGALAAALARGAGMRDAVAFANAAGALATTRAGAQPSLPRLADVTTLLASAAHA